MQWNKGPIIEGNFKWDILVKGNGGNERERGKKTNLIILNIEEKEYAARQDRVKDEHNIYLQVIDLANIDKYQGTVKEKETLSLEQWL